MKYAIYGIAHVSKFLGEVEADSKDEAENIGWDEFAGQMSMSVCHQCSNRIGGDQPEITELQAEPIADLEQPE